MPRGLSANALLAANARETGEVWAFLIEINHETLTVPFRFTNNNEAIISGGETFTPFPFDVGLPDSETEQLPQVNLTIDAVDQSIAAALRAISTPPSVTLRLVMASQPDTIEAIVEDLQWRGVGGDVRVIEGTLTAEDILGTAYPARRFTPDLFPALY